MFHNRKAGPCGDHRAGIGGLMICGGGGKGDENRRPPNDRNIRNGGRACAADYQLRLSDPARDIIEKGLHLGGDTQIIIGTDDAINILGAGLLRHAQARQNTLGQFRHRIRHNFRQDTRALAATDDHK